MERLTTTKRIELEIEMRKAAINIAHFGLAGIDFFCQQFPDIAKEYAQGLEEERNKANQFSLTEA
ncbi:MAG: hypothetical protein LBG18_07810 [Mediterranea sp.]|jgi:hypothetical protein|nr:hypothetical protein [Mediterranea sp.]